VGGVDLAIRDDDSLALIELKWDRRTLAACAWDAMKLAAALHLIPARWTLRSVHTAALTRRDAPWAIRVVELELESDDLVALDR
jgi:hypothetical protein